MVVETLSRRTMMFAAILFLTVSMLVSQVAPSQSQSKLKTIVGLPPYEFGIPMNAILKLNPSLQLVPPSWVGTLQYRGRIELEPPATLSLSFWRGKLAVVGVSWSIEDANRRDTHIKVTYERIKNSYDWSSMKIKSDEVNPFATVLDFVDSKGSNLAFVGGSFRERVILQYSWGPFWATSPKDAPGP